MSIFPGECGCGCGCSSDPLKLFSGSENVPADATVLFDGKSLAGWVKRGSGEPAGWKIENGYMEVVPGTGDICTRDEWHDIQLHVEFWLPLMAEASGQGRANSGVYLQGTYEVQVLDSYGLDSKDDDCGGIYKTAAPMVNASRPPEQWQTYDMFFVAPKFDESGNKIEDARLTVLHNGVFIHHGRAVPKPTGGELQRDLAGPGPLMLQDHGNLIRYRNIWVREV